MSSSESFSPTEIALLAPYVSNTDHSIFVLTNLPEVIKGALFSRYSRSPRGLREILLKEFIQDPESAFQSIQGISQETKNPEKSYLAIEKAQDFYDRILDGYGDDSIGELGGAHVAFENVSILATKVLQDARIGGSPLEKSTRYVDFGSKVNGDYLFYKDPKIMASPQGERYLRSNRFLFETYGQLTEPMKAYVTRQMPRDTGISDAAYQRSVKAKVYDLIRGLLPASTLTNMGFFGNGRFFETLLSKLHIQELSELQSIGGEAFGELSKVLPSFVRRAHVEHRHFKSFQQFQNRSSSLIQSFCDQQIQPSVGSDRAQVELIDYDDDAEAKWLAAWLYPHSTQSLSELRRQVRLIPHEAKAQLFQESMALREHRRHKPGRSLEMVSYTFDILGDYGMYRDLQRHRLLTQERQPLSPHFGYHLPEEIVDAGFGDIYRNALEQAAETYDQLFPVFPLEAQYVVPLCSHIRWFMHMNLRSLMWFTELRSTPQGHESYRRVAQEMAAHVKRVHPLLGETLKFVDFHSYSLGRLDAEIRLEQKK